MIFGLLSGRSSAINNHNVSAAYIFERHFESDSLCLDAQSPEWRVYQQIAMFLVDSDLLCQLQTFSFQRLTKLFLCLTTADTNECRHFSCVRVY